MCYQKFDRPVAWKITWNYEWISNRIFDKISDRIYCRKFRRRKSWKITQNFERWNFLLSAKCEKIRDLGKKDSSWNWTPDHEEEFIALKKEIIGNRSVIPFDLRKNIEIYTDAAKTGGFGYALCQPNEDGDDMNCAAPFDAYCKSGLSMDR